MTKRKKGHKKSGTRRRRSVGKIDIMSSATPLLLAIGGAVVQRIAANKLATTIDSKIIDGVSVGAGLALPMFIKAPWAKSVGLGMGVGGGIGLLSGMGVLGAIGAGPGGYMYLNGMGDQYNSSSPGSGVGAAQYLGATYMGNPGSNAKGSNYLGCVKDAVNEELYNN